MPWKEHTFGALAAFAPRVPMTRGEEYPFVDMDAIDPNSRYVETSLMKKYASSGCSRFVSGDVLLARITPCLENGKIAQARISNASAGFGSTEFFVLRAKDEAADSSFLFYLTKSDLVWKSAVNSMVGASGRQRADASFIKKVRLKIPQRPVQRKIAAVLSVYDDLIDTNRRRIASLERLAEEVYREWFVRLRFPNHGRLTLEPVPLRSFVSEYIGGDWGEDVRSPKFANRVNIIRGTDFENVCHGNVAEVPIRFVTDAGLRSRRLQVGDLVVENSVNHRTRTAGKSLLVTQHVLDLFDGDVICASFCKLIRPKSVMHSRFLALNFRLLFDQGLFDYFQNIATNGIANLQAERFMDRHLVPFHTDIDLSVFESFDTSAIALAQAKLSATRDALLPRLISGQLSVEDLDIQFPPSMAEGSTTTDQVETVHA